MRFIFFLNLFLLLLISKAHSQNVDSVWFSASNFSYCEPEGPFHVESATRYFDALNSTYHFQFNSTTNTNVTNLNSQGSTSSSSTLTLSFGFKTVHEQPEQFCNNVVSKCPIAANSNFTIQKAFHLGDLPIYPLADITAQYSALSPDSSRLVCITFAPVGFQHPTWKQIFTWIPVSFTVSAAIISLIASLTIFQQDGHHDIFLLSSNYAMLPGVLRLKMPGFFDLVFYSQFIVTAGQFNIAYPRFHALFTSNFAWSFLLFNSNWLKNTVFPNLFKGSSSTINNVASIPGLSIYKRQQIDNDTTSDTSNTTVQGTGMSEFATATGIDINGLFFTMFVYLLAIITICLLLCFLAFCAFYLLGKATKNDKYSVGSKKMRDFSVGVIVRIVSLLFMPMATISFYQLMLPSHWYITFLAAICLVVPFLLYSFISIKLLKIRPKSFIYTELKVLLRYGTLYNEFTDDTFHFFIVILAFKSLVAAMIGLFQTSGVAQLVLVVIAESALLGGSLYKWPYADKTVNIQYMILNCIRIVVLLLNIVYIPALHSTALTKQYIGYCQVSIHCLVFFLFLVLQIKNAIVILTGLGEDELDESGKPPARMVFWRIQKNKRRSRTNAIDSTATLMTYASGGNRPQNASFYLENNSNSARNSGNRLTSDSHILNMFNQYYGTNSTGITLLKPDEVTKYQIPNEVTPEAIAEYQNNSSTNGSSYNNGATPTYINKQEHKPIANMHNNTKYKLDDEIVPCSEPLIDIQQRSPPPLPRHANTMPLILSPPHN